MVDQPLVWLKPYELWIVVIGDTKATPLNVTRNCSVKCFAEPVVFNSVLPAHVLVSNTLASFNEAYLSGKLFGLQGLVLGPAFAESEVCEKEIPKILNPRGPRWAVHLKDGMDVKRFWGDFFDGKQIGHSAKSCWGAAYDSMSSLLDSFIPLLSTSVISYGDHCLGVRQEGGYVFLQDTKTHKILCTPKKENRLAFIDYKGWPVSRCTLFIPARIGKVRSIGLLKPIERGETVKYDGREMLGPPIFFVPSSLSFSCRIVRNVFDRQVFVAITELDLRSLNLFKIPSSLSRATALRVLDLSYNCISDVPAWTTAWTDLRELDLTQNRLERFLEKVVWPKLEVLVLTNNAVKELPSFRAFSCLAVLRLECCPISSLPHTLGSLPKLSNVHVDGCKKLEPSELRKMPPGSVAFFVRQRHMNPCDTSIFYRIMLIGKAGQGKTSLVQRLTTGKAVSAERNETFGINIVQWRPSSICVDNGKVAVDIDFWDCAGQPHFYPTHWMFLVPDAVFWVVFSLDEAEKDPEAAVKEVLEFVRFVRSISITAGIMIVGTKVDLKKQHNLTDVLNRKLHTELSGDKYIIRPRFDFYVVSVCSLDVPGIKNDGIRIIQLCQGEWMGNAPKQLIPELFFKVERDILEFSSKLTPADLDDPYAEPIEGDKSPFMSARAFKSNFQLTEVSEDEMVPLWNYLVQRGVILMTKQWIVIAPQRMMNDVIYRLFTLKIGNGNGMVLKSSLVNLWVNVSDSRKEILLDLLCGFEVAFPVTEDEWLIPILAQEAQDLKAHEDCTRLFFLRLSAPIYGIYSLLLNAWFRMFPYSNDELKKLITLRRDQVEMCFPTYDNKGDRCVVDLQNSSLIIRATENGLWLADQVLDRLERLVRRRFPLMKVSATDSDGVVLGETELIRKTGRSCQRARVYSCENILPGHGSLILGVQYDVMLFYGYGDVEFAMHSAREMGERGLRCSLYEWADILEPPQDRPDSCHFTIFLFSSSSNFQEYFMRNSCLNRAGLKFSCARNLVVLLDCESPQQSFDVAVFARLTRNPMNRDAVALADNVYRVLQRDQRINVQQLK